MRKLFRIIKNFFIKYSHLWTLVYILIYIPWFTLIEKLNSPNENYYNIHIAFDDKIPFCEYFVVPYLLWFIYVPVIMGIIAYKSKNEFYRASIYLFSGMSICLFICTIWPNGQDLRIANLDPDKNIFTAIMKFIYHADTNTNVFPSIHSYNSVAVLMMMMKTTQFTGRIKRVIIYICFTITTSIVLSTLFLKQHSVIDAIGGVSLAVVMYVVVYCINWKAVYESQKEKKQKKNIQQMNAN